jgi:hypothetical protein
VAARTATAGPPAFGLVRGSGFRRGFRPRSGTHPNAPHGPCLGEFRVALTSANSVSAEASSVLSPGDGVRWEASWDWA